MKQAYTISPEQYRAKEKELNSIGYKYGHYNWITHKYEINEDAPDWHKKRFKKLTAEIESVNMPTVPVFFENADLYNLWLNRDTDEPLTTKELYNIILGVATFYSRKVRNITLPDYPEGSN